MTTQAFQPGSERLPLQSGRLPGAGEPHRFGTFGGVFTPTILTILGVIMFLRADFVVGHAGILQALLILLLAKAITFLSTLSISAVSTNTEVRGGGAYFLISRSLGPEFGGAIGLTLYLAQALSVPFYVLGFVEALVATFPGLMEHARLLCLATAVILFIVAYVGANWAIRFQYVVLVVLICSILSFLAGAIVHFDTATFTANLSPAPVTTTPSIGFFALFAIYFPAVTGIMAGINMSGDLKEPARSIPKGTLAAVGLGFLVYLAQMVLCGGAIDRADLIERPYRSLVDIGLFGGRFVITAGVFAATISSAMGSLVGAPRILQALARDDIFRT
ncbi:amino acid permease, partial [Planctomycetota bacterium]